MQKDYDEDNRSVRSNVSNVSKGSKILAMQLHANKQLRNKDNYMNKTLERARSHADKLKKQGPSRVRQEEINKLDIDECKEDTQALED